MVQKNAITGSEGQRGGELAELGVAGDGRVLLVQALLHQDLLSLK